MIVFFSAEYVKAVGYMFSGFAITRVWFAKEISTGKKIIQLLEAKAVAAEATIKASIEKLKADVAKVETAVVNEAKKL